MKKKIIKLYGFKEWGKEQMKDPEFVKALQESDDDPFIETTWQLLKLRENLGLTQKEFAKKLHVSQEAIARLESPRYRGYSLQTLNKIAHKFDKKLQIRFI